MSTDESYREYLRPGDLRTAEDVYRWMCSPVGKRIAYHRMWLLSKGEYAYLDHYEDYVMLRTRLDRERRQACRRAPLYAWRRFSTIVRLRGNAALVSLVFGSDRNGVGRETRDALAHALAFRTEARRP